MGEEAESFVETNVKNWRQKHDSPADRLNLARGKNMAESADRLKL